MYDETVIDWLMKWVLLFGTRNDDGQTRKYRYVTNWKYIQPSIKKVVHKKTQNAYMYMNI